MKSIKGLFIALVAAAGLVSQALAFTVGEAVVFDHKVSGVYRDGSSDGLVYIKRSGERMVIVQGENSPVLIIESVKSPSSIQQTINAIDDDGDTYTFNLISSMMVVYDPDGGKSRMTRIRSLSERDVERIDPIVRIAAGSYAAAEAEKISASFDCASAATNVEKMICGSAAIAKLDVDLAQRYTSLIKLAPQDKKLAQTEQREWLKERNQCSTERCLKESYNARISELDTILRHMNKPAEFR